MVPEGIRTLDRGEVQRTTRGRRAASNCEESARGCRREVIGRWAILATPCFGGRIRVVATIEDPLVIRKILTHLGLPSEVPALRPPPSDFFGLN